MASNHMILLLNYNRVLYFSILCMHVAMSSVSSVYSACTGSQCEQCVPKTKRLGQCRNEPSEKSCVCVFCCFCLRVCQCVCLIIRLIDMLPEIVLGSVFVFVLVCVNVSSICYMYMYYMQQCEVCNEKSHKQMR